MDRVSRKGRGRSQKTSSAARFGEDNEDARRTDRCARRERLRPRLNRANESVAERGGRESIDGIMHRAA